MLTQSLSFSRRRFLQLTGGAATLSLLSACVATTTAPATPTPVNNQPQRGGVLRVAVIDDLVNLDPALAFNIADLETARLVYETLTRSAENEPGAPLHPLLAEAWSMNETATMYTFNLRQGVTFQHGTPFTAKDVEYSINRLLDPALSPSTATSLSSIDKIEIIDDFTIKFHLKVPDVALPATLSNLWMQIVPHDRTAEQLGQAASGTGPFVIAERIPGERTSFKRNQNYWDQERPYLDEVQLLVIPESAGQIAALTSGSVDLVQTVGLESIALLEGALDVSLLESSQGSYPAYVLRVDQKPFDDLRVRQAFKHAVDRTALLQAMTQGYGHIGNDQPIGPGTPFWADVPPLDYNIEKAKALLAEAGYTDGVTITLDTATDWGGPRINDAAIAIQEMVKAAGFTITIEQVPLSTFWAERYMQTPFFAVWWQVFSEPNNVLPLAFSSQGLYNESGWHSTQVDDLINAGRGEQDEAKRKQIYAEVQQIISEEGGVLIPYFAPYLQAIRNNVYGHQAAMNILYQNIWLAQG